MNFQNMHNVITTTELKDVDRGRVKGLVEGERNALCRTASAMKEKGLALDTIADITGLSLDEIERL